MKPLRLYVDSKFVEEMNVSDETFEDRLLAIEAAKKSEKLIAAVAGRRVCRWHWYVSPKVLNAVTSRSESDLARDMHLMRENIPLNTDVTQKRKRQIRAGEEWWDSEAESWRSWPDGESETYSWQRLTVKVSATAENS